LRAAAAGSIVRHVTRRAQLSSMFRRALPWLALLIAALWATHGAAPAAHFPVGSKLPVFSARLSDGSSFTLGATPQVVVLSFWASYCGPCRAEAPLLSAAQASDIRVLGLSVEGMSLPEIAQSARALGMHYAVGGADDALLRRFDVRSVPTTYVIAPDGRIVLSRVGAISHQELEAALTAARRQTS
jgi:thiol-disulfide isomerase/thioredoxin